MMNIEQITNLTHTNNKQSYYRDIIALYCPEKVGSTSIVTSIRLSASDKFMVLHTHENKVANIINQCANSINISDIVLNSSIINPHTNVQRRIFLIDIYRTPIERKISYYFQKISEEHFNNSEEEISKYPIEKLIKRFNDIFTHIEEIDYYNEFYNAENKITQFDFENKYIISNLNGDSNVFGIKLRLSDSKEWGSILSKLLGCQIIMTWDYDTTKKHIGEKYKEFLSKYRIPYNYYKLIESDSSLHIYLTDVEKQEYLFKWFNKISKQYTPFDEKEYHIYKMICAENSFYCANTHNIHYGDDGCLCSICCKKRKKIHQMLIKHDEISNIDVRHKYDSTYDNYLYLKLYPFKDKSKSTEITINLINS